MKCPRCNNENNESNVYCTSCGYKMNSENTKVCTCGQVNSISNEKCINCGKDLNDANSTTCPNCNSQNSLDDLYCTSCGCKLPKQNSAQSFSVYNPEAEKYDGFSKLALILSIIGLVSSIICCCVPFVVQAAGIILGILGIVFGVKGLKGDNRGKSITAIVLSSIAIVICVVFLLLYSVALGMVNSMSEEELQQLLRDIYGEEYVASIIKSFFIK